MSTNALIGKKNDDGTVDAIYLHYDGYPEQAGATLKAHYSSDADAGALVALGDCSTLGETVQCSQFYARDLAEPPHKMRAQHLADGSAFLAAAFEYQHAYLWDGADWKHWQPKR